MPVGSRPGERRGGRKKGSVARKISERRIIASNVAALIQEGNGTRRLQNASTEEQAQAAAREIAEARARQVPLAKDALSTFLGIFMGRASYYQARGVDPGTGAERNTNANEDKFEKYARLSVEVAKALAPYQSPTYRAIVVAPPPQATQTKRRFTLAVYDNRNGNEIKAVFQTDGAPTLDPRVIDAADEDSDKDENGSS